MTNPQNKIPVAMLIIDVINDFKFEEAPLLLKTSAFIADKIKDLKIRCKEKGIPVIYVNDNFGQWQSDKQKLVEYCSKQAGSHLVKTLIPNDDDYFVVKPKHSGFFSTPLSSLLNELGVETLILSGIAGNICVLFTANDAYMRDYSLYTPSDCIASNIDEDNERALILMEKTLTATISPSHKLDLSAIIEKTKENKQRTIY
ncbi:isochorismatase family cysteine hydrolase [Bacillus sp. NEB1478]|uniref:isochorismatase family cysteine hydrolase n=1 Tax=Bacillus sp. NEB1478 TaxID=3073816 RepID=UPI002872C132|nr:isochorismatase family cysteine hydrolase [Bacillus sp. NEB1478]WNB92064.1 isochorismatase family cysteine hydrolase [Bacillus sp. NEB1478]